MRPLSSLFVLLLAVCVGCVEAAPGARPNFLVIVADDLGYSDLGAFGGEISTPSLDALASDGLRLSGFHTAATCSPTRAMLLTGTDHHLAGMANMSELITPSQRGRPGYDGHLADDVVTVAELLRDAGYRTLMSGKWHLGTRPEDDPSRRGFERVFSLIEGGHNHFGKPNLPPPELGGAHYTEDGRPVSIPADFYSSDYFTDKLLQFMTEDRGRPFFAYLPFTAPHWPLHAPPEIIARYAGRYDAGWEVLLRERLARQRALGLLPPGSSEELPPTLRDWESLSPEEQRRQARKMEIYAAMVERMDWNVGRVIESLRASGRLEDTVIVFFSDNGAAPDTVAGLLKKVEGFAPLEEGVFADWGSAESMLSYGPHWAQAATAPRRLYKSVVSEGGIASPAIVRFPGFARQNGNLGASFATVMDVAPTLLEIAGVAPPGTSYRGRAVEPMRGRSMLPYLQGRAERVHAADEAFGWELFGQRALRQGDWKAVWLSMPNGPGRWALFDLARDPGERHDLAQQEPARLEALVRLWDGYAKDMGVILEEQVVSPHTNL